MVGNELTLFRIFLCLAGLILAVSYHQFHRPGVTGRLQRALYLAVLGGFTCLSFYAYVEIAPPFGTPTINRVMNPHDFYHYYVGSKYQDEVGYFDLYECTVQAGLENGRSVRPDWRIRSLRTYKYEIAGQIAERSDCKERFSPERWREFRSDIRAFSRKRSPKRWNLVLKDKGYNATPVWNAFAAQFTTRIQMTNSAGVWLLMSLDFLWIAIAIFLVGRNFGWTGAMFVLLFWSTNFVSSLGFVKGSISRLDWLLCLIAAMCLLKRGRHGWAGVMAAVATALRIFPVLFFAGLAFKAVWEIFKTRSVPRSYLRFLVGFCVCLALLCGVTALSADARADWADFFVKIQGHDEQIAGYRVGLKYALLDHTLWGGRALADLESKRVYSWLAQLAMLGAVFLASRRLKDHETMAVSIGCVVFLTAPTFYYYEMLVIPVIFLLPDLRREKLSIGLGVFFAWSALLYAAKNVWPLGAELSHWISWSLIGLFAMLVGIAMVSPGAPSDPVSRDS